MNIADAIRWQSKLITVDTVLARILGWPEAILLCRILWAQPDPDTWVERSQEEFEQETALSKEQQRRAFGVLKAKGLIEVKHDRYRHETRYRVIIKALDDLEYDVREQIWGPQGGGASFAKQGNPTSRNREGGAPEETRLREAGKPDSVRARAWEPDPNRLPEPEPEPETGDKETETVLCNPASGLPVDGTTCEPTQAKAAGTPPTERPRVPPPRSAVLPISQDESTPGGSHQDTKQGVKDPPTPQSGANPGAKKETPTPQEVVEAWNTVAKANGLPEVKVLSTERLRSLKRRLKDEFFAEHFRTAMEGLAAEPFMRGENDRGWTANFDYFIRPGTVVRAMERQTTRRVEPAGTRKPAPAKESEKEIMRKVLG